MFETAETLPAFWYHDPVIYALEREEIFKREWQVFAHELLLRDPGSYVADTVAGFPVFVLRGRDGRLKAYHNVCRHRAGPLFETGCGKAAVLRCRYHGWVYDEDGALKKTPDFGEAKDFDCKDFPLFRIHVEVWRGLVFVNLAENPMPLEQALGDLPGAAAKLDLESWTHIHQVKHRLHCNWKTYVENYMEGYHIPVVHPGLSKEVDMKTYRVRVADRIALHESGTREGAVNAGLWPWIYPNTAINVYAEGMNIETMAPLGPETMEIRYFYLFRHADGGSTMQVSQAITQEDIDICEAVQRNLKSGIYDTGRLSPRHENGVAYFQSLVRAAVQPHLNGVEKKAPESVNFCLRSGAKLGTTGG